MRSEKSQNLTKSLSLILSTDLAPKLRQMALEAGWPAHIIAQLEVRMDGDEMYVYYPDSMKTEVENLEYGDINSLPNAVIRPFLYRAGDINQDAGKKRLFEDLISDQLAKVL